MKGSPFEATLKKEGLAPLEFRAERDGGDADRIAPERGARAGGTRNEVASPEVRAFTAEMAGAIHDIVDHPALEPRHREILQAYLGNDCVWEKVAKKAKCSMSKISEVIERVKELMLHPDEMPTAVDVSDENDDVMVTSPEAALSFSDIEESLALSAKTAHRIIKHVSTVPIIGNGELKANESATRTLILIRRDELQYLNKGGKRGAKADPDELHAIASQNKVTR